METLLGIAVGIGLSAACGFRVFVPLLVMNPLFSTLELVGSIFTALLAILVPILCLALIALLCIFVIRRAGRLVLGRIRMDGR